MKADGAQGRRFPGLITSRYLPNNALHLTRLTSARTGFQSDQGEVETG